MQTDIEIAQQAKLRPIEEIAREAGFLPAEVELYGHYKAKISLSALKRLSKEPDGRLILVSAMTPTPWGEGKTTNTIGLAQGFNKLGRRAFAAIRQPSLGPCMGVKGGAAGGRFSQVLPMEDINLHFTGDMYAVSEAHNLLAAMVDNHIHQGNAFGIDVREVVWRRVMDMNDRALRKIVVGLGEGVNGVLREDGFDITAASEVMAIICLAQNISELKMRLAKIVVGHSFSGKPITAADLRAQGAMALLLKDALKPNLVQTIEGGPAFVHGGPFANIAHGCSSLVATKLALKLSEYVVTEAGFGVDLGAEKFFDIKCREGQLEPAAVVVVVSTRALKRQGGVKKEELVQSNPAALEKGLANLGKHLESVAHFNVPAVVAINHFNGDDSKEIKLIEEYCRRAKVPVKISEAFAKGGDGTKALAKTVESVVGKGKFKPLYPKEDGIKIKIEKIAKNIYGADGVDYTPEAEKEVRDMEQGGFAGLPICVAKTPLSLTDDHTVLGRPRSFRIKVKQLKVSAGAGFIVAFTGDIVTMPGLPKAPAAENMDIDENYKITGLF